MNILSSLCFVLYDYLRDVRNFHTANLINSTEDGEEGFGQFR